MRSNSHASLDEILKYEHPAVVRRYQREYPSRAHQAEALFKDLLRFFWASSLHHRQRAAQPEREELDFIFIMDEEMLEIDRMWHLFLLYTRDYAAFCDRYFGEFLHHEPDVVPTLDQSRLHMEQNLERFLGYVYDHLGEATVRRWFPKSLEA